MRSTNCSQRNNNCRCYNMLTNTSGFCLPEESTDPGRSKLRLKNAEMIKYRFYNWKLYISIKIKLTSNVKNITDYTIPNNCCTVNAINSADIWYRCYFEISKIFSYSQNWILNSVPILVQQNSLGNWEEWTNIIPRRVNNPCWFLWILNTEKCSSVPLVQILN